MNSWAWIKTHLAPDTADPASEIQHMFPLRLTAFERYMIADDTPAYPMTFVIELALSGELDEGQLTAALETAVCRHPLLRARLARVQGRLCWVATTESPKLVIRSDDACPLADDSRRIDLWQESGLRIAVSKQGQTVRVRCLFHHACTDGVGAMQFLGDLLALYGQRTLAVGEESPELLSIEPQLLRQRDLSAKKHSGKMGLCWDFLRFVQRVSFPLSLPIEGARVKSTSRRLPFVSRILDRHTVRSLKTLAARMGVYPNDLYLAGLILTLREWNTRQGLVPRGKTFRVLIPNNLRTPVHDALPAANVVSYLFLQQSPASGQDLEELVQSCHQELKRELEPPANEHFLRLLRLGRLIPGCLKLSCRLPLTICTCVLANVGDVRRQFHARFPVRKGKCVAGSLTLDGLFGAAPIRRGTRLGISLGIYAQQLFVNFNCDPNFFNEQQEQDFADLFIKKLEQLCNGKSDGQACENQNHAAESFSAENILLNSD